MVDEGNLNAPRAVTMSAVIYCLRCLVRREIPLNQGCLNPVRVLIPEVPSLPRFPLVWRITQLSIASKGFNPLPLGGGWRRRRQRIDVAARDGRYPHGLQSLRQLAGNTHLTLILMSLPHRMRYVAGLHEQPHLR